MIIDGKKIAEEVRKGVARRVQAHKKKISLVTLVTQQNFVTEKFVAIKKKAAESVGVDFSVTNLDTFGTTEDFVRSILHTARDHDGIIVQLPLAHYIEEDSVRQILPITHDVDVYGAIAYSQYTEGRLPILPPVVAAISDILHQSGISVAGKKVVIVGEGRLVGAPAKIWFTRMGAHVESVNKETIDIYNHTSGADVIISGAGVPHLIRPDMVKDGVMILDAGTSEAGGELSGDVDPAVAEKASLFTPVPGGIGPVAVMKIFENLLTLKERRDAAGI